MAGIAY